MTKLYIGKIIQRKHRQGGGFGFINSSSFIKEKFFFRLAFFSEPAPERIPLKGTDVEFEIRKEMAGIEKHSTLELLKTTILQHKHQ